MSSDNSSALYVNIESAQKLWSQLWFTVVKYHSYGVPALMQNSRQSRTTYRTHNRKPTDSSVLVGRPLQSLLTVMVMMMMMMMRWWTLMQLLSVRMIMICHSLVVSCFFIDCCFQRMILSDASSTPWSTTSAPASEFASSYLSTEVRCCCRLAGVLLSPLPPSLYAETSAEVIPAVNEQVTWHIQACEHDTFDLSREAIDVCDWMYFGRLARAWC